MSDVVLGRHALPGREADGEPLQSTGPFNSSPLAKEARRKLRASRTTGSWGAAGSSSGRLLTLHLRTSGSDCLLASRVHTLSGTGAQRSPVCERYTVLTMCGLVTWWGEGGSLGNCLEEPMGVQSECNCLGALSERRQSGRVSGEGCGEARTAGRVGGEGCGESDCRGDRAGVAARMGVGTCRMGILEFGARSASCSLASAAPCLGTPSSLPWPGASRSQGWSSASDAEILRSTSGVSIFRKRSQQGRERCAGRLSSGGGQRSPISASSRAVFTFVAWCGSVNVSAVEPGPRYVRSNWDPFSNWIMVTPALQKSTASVWTPIAPNISGAMYWKVPARQVGASWTAEHQPKSAIFSTSSWFTRRFSGFRSLCTTFWEWR
mmetsp:Transcript_52854/g.163535  ORF Transcript_52854/g.163535 Transcript_52854/m.163535 type:complete len:378 (-) Transcript_52854:37-1170(-)